MILRRISHDNLLWPLIYAFDLSSLKSRIHHQKRQSMFPLLVHICNV